jgi:hypothetical protein
MRVNGSHKKIDPSIFKENSHKSVLTNHDFCFLYIFGFLVFLFLQSAFFFCGMKLSLAANLVLNWVCPVLFFPERFQRIAAAMCTVAINVLEPGAFNAETPYSIPYLIKFHDFVENIQEGMKHQNGGSNSCPTGHHFRDNSDIYFLFFAMRTGPFSKCENRSGSQIGCQVRTE